MKDSGVSWIGETPAHWAICRVKDKCGLMGGSTPSAPEIGDEFNLHWATPSDFEDISRSLNFTTRKISEVGHRQIGNTLVRRGSILVSCRAPAGKVAYVTSSLSFNQGCKGLFPRKDIYGVYLFYVIASMRGAIESEARGTTFQEISGVNLGRIHITFPPLTEQRAIADYLDRQTALIDQRLSTLAEKKTVLAELRKATIHEAVTKGLNKNAPMKDSGVPWIGEIPQGWMVKRMKDCYISNSRPQPNNTVLSLSYGKVIVKDMVEKKGVTPESYDSYQGVLPGDVILRLTDLQNDQKSLRVGRATTSGIITSAYLCVSSRMLDDRYSAYLLHDVGDIQKVFYGLGGGVRQSMKFADLAELLFPLPTKAEQLTIANHLDQQTQHIDAQLATLDEQAQVLKELRKAIIHEAVTGKIDLSGT